MMAAAAIGVMAAPVVLAAPTAGSAATVPNTAAASSNEKCKNLNPQKLIKGCPASK